jgi:hypothetical protein
MTASLNASTTSGVVLTSDTSGNLALQSNGTTIATAQSTGLNLGSNGLIFSDSSQQTSAAFSPSTLTVYWYNNSVVTSGRATSTVYQNTSGKTRYVLFAYTNTGGPVYVDNVNGSTTAINYIQGGGSAPWNTIFFIVPNNYYYKINPSVGSIYGWTEWQ